VATKTSPPQKRDTKSKDARSTVGQVAAKAGTSIHKARQAVAVQKAIEAGEPSRLSGRMAKRTVPTVRTVDANVLFFAVGKWH